VRAAARAASIVWIVLVAVGHGGARAADQDTAGPLPTPAPAVTVASPPPAAGQAGRPFGRSVVGRIRGTVLDTGRKPVPGLMVQLRARDQAGLLRVTGTDEKGQYLFRDLPQGVYDVEVGADGFSRVRKENILVRPPFQNIVDFQMQAMPIGSTGAGAATGAEPEAAAPVAAPPPGAGEPAAAAMVPVRGTFLDGQRRPVPEASVTLIALSSTESYQAFSGIDGTFEIPSVVPGPYRVVVESPGYVAIDLKSVTVLSGNGLNINLSLVEHALSLKKARERELPLEEPLPPPAAPQPPPQAEPREGETPAPEAQQDSPKPQEESPEAGG